MQEPNNGPFHDWLEEWHTKLTELLRNADAIRTASIIQASQEAVRDAIINL